MVTQRIANPCIPVRFRASPPPLGVVRGRQVTLLFKARAATGRRLRSVRLPEYHDPDDRTGAFACGQPVFAGGRLLLTNSDGALLSFDPATGAAGASVPISGLSGVPPVVADGTVYVVTTGGELVAFR